MIYEQPAIFGIIPIGKKRVLSKDEKIVLSSRLRGGINMRELNMVVTGYLHVIDGSNVEHYQNTAGILVPYMNDSPEEINSMNIKGSGCFIKNVYRYTPDKVPA